MSPMPGSLDPRAWNLGTLAAGLVLVAGGCSVRVLSGSEADGESGDEGESGNESESDSSDSGSSDAPTTTTDNGDDPGGCRTDAECPIGYYCFDGVCEYIPAPDGSHWYECYADEECGVLGLCVDYSCEFQTSPPTCDPPAAVEIIPLPLADAALALSFADVDGDGAEELVVATQAALHVFESGSDESMIGPRGIESDQISDIAAGQLDAMPGDDLTILVGDDLRLVHASDGVDGFAPAVEAPLSLASASGLIVAEFNGAAPEDLLVWGSDGASLETGGAPQLISGEPISSAVYRPPERGAGGFALREPNQLAFFDLDGESSGTLPTNGNDPAGPLVTRVEFGEPLDSDGRLIGDSWTLLSHYRFNPPTFAAAWGVPLRIDDMAAAKLDDDMYEDIVIIADGELWIYREVGFLPEECLTQVAGVGPVVELAVGDHDGDGDEEVAVRFETGEVAVIDDQG